MSVVAPVSISVPKDGKAGRNDASCKVKVVRSEERERAQTGDVNVVNIYFFIIICRN